MITTFFHGVAILAIVSTWIVHPAEAIERESNKGIIWRDITIEGVRELTRTNILSARKQDFENLPPLACSGFQEWQVEGFPFGYHNTACQGLHPLCISNMTNSARNKLLPYCVWSFKEKIGGISALRVSWSEGQVLLDTKNDLNLRAEVDSSPDWSNLSREDVSNLTIGDILSATRFDIEKIPPHSCSGFRSEQIGWFPYGLSNTACQGLQSLCVSNMTNGAISGFNYFCVFSFSPDTLSTLNASQLIHITSPAINGITGSVMRQIPPATLSEIGKIQVFNLSFDSANTACAVLNDYQIQAINETGFSGFTAKCFFTMNMYSPNALTKIIPSQLKNLSNEAFSSINGDLFKNMNPTVFRNITSELVSLFGSSDINSACSKLTAEQSSLLPAESYQGFMKDCVTRIDEANGDAFAEVTAAQIKMLPSARFKDSVGAKLMLKINPEAYSGLSDIQVSEFSYEDSSSACHGLQEDGMVNLIDTRFANLSLGCVTAMCNNGDSDFVRSFGSISGAQLSNLTDDCLSAIYGPFFGTINGKAFSGLSARQLGLLDTSHSVSSGCANIKSEQVLNLTLTTFSGWEIPCFSLMEKYSPSAFSTITPELFAALPLKCFQAMDFVAFNRAIPPTAFANLEIQVAWFSTNGSDSFCATALKEQIAGLQKNAFAKFTDKCFAAMSIWNADALSSISGAQLGAILSDVFKTIGGELLVHIPTQSFENLTSVQFSAFSINYTEPVSSPCALITQDIIAVIPSSIYSGLEPKCVTAMDMYSTGSPLEGITAAQLAQVQTPAVINVLTNKLIKTIPEISFTQLSANQVSAFSSTGGITSACSGLASGQIHAIPYHSFSGWKYDCVSVFGSGSLEDIDDMQFRDMEKSKGIPAITGSVMTLIKADAFSNLTSSGIEQFCSEGCSGLRTTQVQEIPAPSFAGFTSDCVSGMAKWAVYGPFNSISSKQFSMLTPEAVGSIGEVLVKQIPASSFSQATGEQVLNFPPDLCENLSPEQLNSIDTTALASLTYLCVSWMGKNSNKPFSQLDAVHLQALPVVSVPAWDEDLVHQIPVDSIRSLTVSQAKALTPSGCGGLDLTRFLNLPDDDLGALTADCVNSLPKELWVCSDIGSKVALFSEDTLKGVDVIIWKTLLEHQDSMAPPVFDALSKAQVNGLPKAIAGSLRPQMCASTNDTGCIMGTKPYEFVTFESLNTENLTWLQALNLNPDFSGEFWKNNLSSEDGFLTYGLLAKDVSSLNCVTLQEAQVFHLFEDCVIEFSAQQVERIEAKAFAGFNESFPNFTTVMLGVVSLAQAKAIMSKWPYALSNAIVSWSKGGLAGCYQLKALNKSIVTLAMTSINSSADRNLVNDSLWSCDSQPTSGPTLSPTHTIPSAQKIINWIENHWLALLLVVLVIVLLVMVFRCGSVWGIWKRNSNFGNGYSRLNEEEGANSNDAEESQESTLVGRKSSTNTEVLKTRGSENVF